METQEQLEAALRAQKEAEQRALLKRLAAVILFKVLLFVIVRLVRA